MPAGDWVHLHTAEVTQALPALPAGSPLRRDMALGDGLFVAGDHRDTPSQQGAQVRAALRASARVSRSDRSCVAFRQGPRVVETRHSAC